MQLQVKLDARLRSERRKFSVLAIVAADEIAAQHLEIVLRPTGQSGKCIPVQLWHTSFTILSSLASAVPRIGVIVSRINFDAGTLVEQNLQKR